MPTLAHFIVPNSNYTPGFIATTGKRVEYRILISYTVTRKVVNFSLN